MNEIIFREIYDGMFELHGDSHERRAFRFNRSERDEFVQATPHRRQQIIARKKATGEFVYVVPSN